MKGIRDLARALKYAPDRLLHPLRRKRAHTCVSAIGCPQSVLFIRLGNINRSPYASFVFRKAAVECGFGATRVKSAGFIGPGRPASEGAQRLAMKRGIDMREHVSRQIDVVEVQDASLIVVMDEQQRRRLCGLAPGVSSRVVVLGDFDPEPVERRTVKDPYGHPDEIFESVFTRIERCVEQLAATAFKTAL